MATVQVISKTNEFDEHFYADCTVYVGDAAVVFKKGRALTADVVAQRFVESANKQVDIPDLNYYPVDATRRFNPAETLHAGSQPQEIPEEIKALLDPENPAAKLLKAINTLPQDKIAQLLEVLSAEAATDPPSTPAAAPAPEAPAAGQSGDGTGEREPDDGEESEAIKAAKAALEEDGEDVPEVLVKERVVPAGFENMTGEGHPRCLAAKGDGGQCQNAAVEGSNACAHPSHKAKLGEDA